VGCSSALTVVVSVLCLPQMAHDHVCVMFQRGSVLPWCEHCVLQYLPPPRSTLRQSGVNIIPHVWQVLGGTCVMPSRSGGSPIASDLRWFCAVRLAFTYRAPMRELHGLHTPRRFSMVSGPPASYGMMWSASVAGALLHTAQVIGPWLNSSLRALRNSGVARRVMLFRFFSSALGCACGCFHVTGWLGAVIAPHTSTYEVWLPDDYTSGRTPLTFVTFGRCTSRS